jgi:YidC/Oxa1 family membrane protein insertase
MMISNLFNLFFYEPLYNGLVFLIGILPVADVGIVIIIFTIIVKLILFPFSIKATKTQVAVRHLEPEMKEIKEKYKDDKQQQSLQMMELYRKNNINPFSGILTLFIQIPIIFALYYIFFRGGLPEINTDILYDFVNVPQTINMMFLGLVDITSKSWPLALLAGVSQFFQIRLAMPFTPPSRDDEGSFKSDLAKGMQFQMKYVFPVFVFFISYTISAAIALYWTTSNLFMIGQELLVTKKMRAKAEEDKPIKE